MPSLSEFEVRKQAEKPLSRQVNFLIEKHLLEIFPKKNFPVEKKQCE